MLKKTIFFLAIAVQAQQITPNNVNPNNKQGNGSKFVFTTGIGNTPGTGVCTDANGNLSITACGIVIGVTAGTGISLTGTNPYTINNTGVLGITAGTGISFTGTNPYTINNGGVISFKGRVGAVTSVTGDYTAAQVTNAVDSTGSYSDPNWIVSLNFSKMIGTKQGNTLVPQMAGTNSGTTGSILCNDASGNATTSGCGGGLLSGLLSAIPATCTVGNALYQATDQPITLQLYACTSTNTWTRVAYTQGTISGIPATCSRGQLYFATDAAAGQNIYMCTATNTWATNSTIPAASAQTQQLTVNSNTGNLTNFTWVNPLLINTNLYNFPAITPTGSPSLIIGSNSLTLPIAPLGLAGADTRHYVYISGGIGTAEAVAITGGSCTSGALNCTILVTCAHTHSGAYNLISASGGIQEAVNVASYDATVYLPSNNGVGYSVYAPIYVPAAVSIRGDGIYKSTIVAQGNVGIFDADGSSGHNTFEDMFLTSTTQQSAGYGIRLGQSNDNAFTRISRVFFFQLYDDVVGVNANNWTVHNTVHYNFAHNGLVAADASGLDDLGPIATDNEFFNYSLSTAANACLVATSTSGIFSNNWCGGAGDNQLNYGVQILTGASSAGGFVINNNQFQTTKIKMIDLEGFNTNIQIVGNQIADGGLTGFGIYIADGGGLHMDQGVISGNTIQGPGTGTSWTGITITGGATNWFIGSNSLTGMPNGITLSGTGNVTLGQNNYYLVTTPITRSSTGTDWIAATLGNGWGNAGSPYNTAGYRIEGGRLYLRGLVQGGTETAGTQIFFISNIGLTGDCILSTWGGANSLSVPVPVTIGIGHTGAVGIQGNSLGSTNFVSLDNLSCSIN